MLYSIGTASGNYIDVIADSPEDAKAKLRCTPKANLLLEAIDYAIENWDERSMFHIGDVRSLSRSDLETLRLYAETITRVGTYDDGSLMPPRGGVEEALSAYGLCRR